MRLSLFDFEGCPFCRIVREAITELDLPVTIFPCPKGGKRYRPKVLAAGGKEQFPYLVDEDRDVAMYESDAIVAYLYRNYGDRDVPGWFRRSALRALLSSAASLVRGGAGTFVRGCVDLPTRPMLYAAEGDPEARLVREELCVLQVDYDLFPLGEGSAHRESLRRSAGSERGPVFIDRDSGRAIEGRAEILAHLRGLATSDNTPD